MDPKEIFQHLTYIDIAIKEKGDLIRWQTGSEKTFPIDILSARLNAKEDVFLHNEVQNRKIVFIQKGKFIFTLGANSNPQFQLLEAIIEEVSSDFMEKFKIIPEAMLSNITTKGFIDLIPDLILKAQKERIKWISTDCKVCKKMIQICVKKSIITNAKHFPTSLVFYHQGHGLLVYLDKDIAVRGAEIVDISS